MPKDECLCPMGSGSLYKLPTFPQLVCGRARAHTQICLTKRPCHALLMPHTTSLLNGRLWKAHPEGLSAGPGVPTTRATP